MAAELPLVATSIGVLATKCAGVADFLPVLPWYFQAAQVMQAVLAGCNTTKSGDRCLANVPVEYFGDGRPPVKEVL